MHINSHKYLITELHFIEAILTVWYECRAAEIKEIIKKIDSFDENKDGLMQFDEFAALIGKLEPAVSK
jgi:hypothetical protein